MEQEDKKTLWEGAGHFFDQGKTFGRPCYIIVYEDALCIAKGTNGPSMGRPFGLIGGLAGAFSLHRARKKAHQADHILREVDYTDIKSAACLKKALKGRVLQIVRKDGDLFEFYIDTLLTKKGWIDWMTMFENAVHAIAPDVVFDREAF